MLYFIVTNWSSGIASGITAGNLFFTATGISLLFYSDFKLWETMAFINMVIAGTAWTYPSYLLGPFAILGMIICNHAELHDWIIVNLVAYLTGDESGPFFSIIFQVIPWIGIVTSAMVMAASYGIGLYQMLTTAANYTSFATNWASWVFASLGLVNVIIDVSSLIFSTVVQISLYL